MVTDGMSYYSLELAAVHSDRHMKIRPSKSVTPSLADRSLNFIMDRIPCRVISMFYICTGIGRVFSNKREKGIFSVFHCSTLHCGSWLVRTLKQSSLQWVTGTYWRQPLLRTDSEKKCCGQKRRVWQGANERRVCTLYQASSTTSSAGWLSGYHGSHARKTNGSIITFTITVYEKRIHHITPWHRLSPFEVTNTLSQCCLLLQTRT